jgi:hypothetical protein
LRAALLHNRRSFGWGATMNVRLAFACAALLASSMASAREDQIIMLGNTAGKQTVSADSSSA